ncbi:MAG TPA: gliding motility-associated C-terminal domain-containing protein [Mucilaginibacter sp.]|nr:gliding motility-associated C-terminal domain-containing protein [Mucilaginibacter sp.]
MRPLRNILIVVFILHGIGAMAQTCTGSLGAPVINETFGAGTQFDGGPQLPSGVTDLQYVFGPGCGGEDGTYAILQRMGSSCKGGTWQAIQQDHTGDKFGYMMVINATIDPSLFFTYKVDGSKLCPNTTYQFAAWIMNILRPLPQTQGFSRPNITFRIEKPDGTLIKKYDTGDIPESEEPTWVQYGTFFTSPSDGSDIVVKMINNGSGGNGNDLALDDITFSACGPLIQTGFGTIGNIEAKSACKDDNLSYTLVATQTGYDNPDYKWQQNLDDGKGWVDIPGEKSLTLKINIPNASAGKYQYRIGVLNTALAAAENCRIYSDPLTINVHPPPDLTIEPATSACAGQPLQLRASGATSYLWTGPRNFASTENSPVVTQTADPGYNGVYHLTVTKDDCPFFATTTVTVFPAATVQPMDNLSVCAGDAVQLHVNSSNATHFKWEPSAGLDHDDIPDPVASPQQTTLYTVSVSNDGCADLKPTSSLTVTVLKRPTADAGASLRMFDGQTVKLSGKALGDNVSWYWTPLDFLDDPGSLTPVSSTTDDITYTLHVRSEVGCGEATSAVFVRVYKLLTVVNSFSPNGDGVNDNWYIKNIENYPRAEISVYSRYGQRVFKSTGYSIPWDGTENGKKLPAGTYYYIIDLKDDYLPKKAGWVLIVR